MADLKWKFVQIFKTNAPTIVVILVTELIAPESSALR